MQRNLHTFTSESHSKCSLGRTNKVVLTPFTGELYSKRSLGRTCKVMLAPFTSDSALHAECTTGAIQCPHHSPVNRAISTALVPGAKEYKRTPHGSHENSRRAAQRAGGGVRRASVCPRPAPSPSPRGCPSLWTRILEAAARLEEQRQDPAPRRARGAAARRRRVCRGRTRPPRAPPRGGEGGREGRAGAPASCPFPRRRRPGRRKARVSASLCPAHPSRSRHGRCHLVAPGREPPPAHRR